MERHDVKIHALDLDKMVAYTRFSWEHTRRKMIVLAVDENGGLTLKPADPSIRGVEYVTPHKPGPDGWVEVTTIDLREAK